MAGTAGTDSTNNPPLGTLTGKLALINRGACSFSEKIAHAKAAGAIAVVIINNVAGDPTAMARTTGFDDGIPAVMIGLAEGAALRIAAPTTASAVATFAEFISSNADILAGFSSQGPTNVNLAIKPDLTSVGVNVLSSITTVGNTGDIWAFFSGTSMATPHIAGSAAVLLALHPGWTPAMVKSALVNRSDRVIKDAKTGTLAVGPQAQGAGRENLTNASTANLFISPVSASYGKIVASKATALTITLSNSLGTDQTFNLSATKFTPTSNPALAPYNAGSTSAGDSRISFPATVTVLAHSSATITVWVNAGAAGSVVQGWIQLANGSNTYHFAYWAYRG
jgi:subtilisin family serine protease